MLVHTMSVEPYLGVSAVGDSFGPAVAVKCYIEDVSRLVGTNTSEQATSGTTVAYAALSDAGNVPVTSKVTLPSGRAARVLQVDTFDTGSLRSGMDHIEIHIA